MITSRAVATSSLFILHSLLFTLPSLFFTFDTAKVQHFSPRSKFSPPIWADFQHELTAFSTTRNFAASRS